MKSINTKIGTTTKPTKNVIINEEIFPLSFMFFVFSVLFVEVLTLVIVVEELFVLSVVKRLVSLADAGVLLELSVVKGFASVVD